MKRRIFKFLLFAALMMCCTVGANAQIARREGNLVKDKTENIGGFFYALYKDYSYTYVYGDNVITKSFSGNCAVVIETDSRTSNISSSVTYNGEQYTVVAIGDGAGLNFNYNIVIPNSVEVIECNSFCDDKTRLGGLTFADGDKDLWCFPVLSGYFSVSGGTFSHINTLTTPYLGRNLRYPGEGDNTKGGWAPFAQGSFSNLEVAVGPNVTKIPDFCFYQQNSGNGVKTLNLTNATSLQSIGQYAFYGCTALTFQDFSNATSLQSIGYGAFAFCTSLENVNFGDIPLSIIADVAFAGCTNLSKVFFFSNTPPTLAKGCFPDNTTVYVKNSKLVTEYKNKSASFTGNIIAYPDNMMLKYQTTDGKIIQYPITMTTGKMNYGPDMIYHSYETGYGTMYFDHVLTSIEGSEFEERGWFEECGLLFSISLPNTITRIEEYAFFKCTNLRTMVIHENVNYIGDLAFKNCVSLRDVFFLRNDDIELGDQSFIDTPATIYVADATNLSQTWDGRPVRSWRSGKGDGTREHPYEIENYINLYGFSLEVLKGNTSICGKLTADITANNGVLNEDGSLKSGPFTMWEPIGGQGYGYRGEFNGGGHTVSGLYFNDESRQAVGLFGKAAGSEDNSTDRSYIHDVGIRDSYFHGKSHVGGICGDLAIGRMENCWNAATVQSLVGVAVGGIAGSCWYYATIYSCCNMGKVHKGTEYGGISGSVYKSKVEWYSIRNCASYSAKCDRVATLCDTDENIIDCWTEDYADGDSRACYILNGRQLGTKWRQQFGKDPYPVLMSGNCLVNYYTDFYSDVYYTYNETMCEKSESQIHDFEQQTVKRCDNSEISFWHCKECGKNYSYEGEGGHRNQTKELSENEYSAHLLEFVNAAVLPTATTTGHYDYWHCSHCNKDFLEGNYSEPKTSEQLTVSVHSNNNEIWYLSTQRKKITPTETGNFGGATYNDANNKYEYGLGKITFDKDVTSIGEEAFNAAPSDTWFNGCVDLQSISIPSSVTSIGRKAFKDCLSLQSVSIPSDSRLTSIGKKAFYKCGLLQSINIPSGVTSIGDDAFAYCNSLQSINIPSGVTSIGGYAFAYCNSLQSINIPSGVTSIGGYAFLNCSNMKSVTFHSVPYIDKYAFSTGKLNIENKVLDLTDSDKPYIGTSLNNYPDGGFTEARYHRTLEKGKWGTIILPFAPTDGLEGLKFYELKEMVTTDGGSLVFTKVDAPKAGVPYLFRNVSDSVTNFTLAANTPNVTVETQGQAVGAFTLKGSFQQVSLNTTEAPNDNLYDLKDNEFWHATGKINIAPFRAYIEGNGATHAKSFMLVVSDNGGDVTAVPGILDADGTLDETEAIYDLNGRRFDAPVKGQINIIRLKSGKTVKQMF